MTTPSLYSTETALQRAFGYVDEIDPDCEMTADEQEAVLLRFVNPDAAREVRDEFAAWIGDMEAWAAAKAERAKELVAEAKKIEARVERAKAATVKLMKALGVDELRGRTARLVIKRSRGRVEIENQNVIPDEFWRLPDTIDQQEFMRFAEFAIGVARERLKETREMYVDSGGDPDSEDGRAVLHDAALLLAEFEQMRDAWTKRHRAVDKVAVQEAWKERGETMGRLDADEHARLSALYRDGEITKQDFDDSISASTVMLPTVPGVRRVVDETLVIK